MVKNKIGKSRRHKEQKTVEDPNVTAKLVVDSATNSGKNPAAVALGRLGGLKGGTARAQKLSAKRRQEIARKAAEVRWHREE